jgi:hypothetical protein
MEPEDFNSVPSKDDCPDALKEAAGASENLLFRVAGQVLDDAIGRDDGSLALVDGAHRHERSAWTLPSCRKTSQDFGQFPSRPRRIGKKSPAP